MCGIIVTGKVQIPTALMIMANCFFSLWSLVKCTVSWIFHVLVESPVANAGTCTCILHN